jgi:hypothetical protein
MSITALRSISLTLITVVSCSHAVFAQTLEVGTIWKGDMDRLKANIEVQFRDGVLKEPLPGPDRYADQSYVCQAKKKLEL